MDAGGVHRVQSGAGQGRAQHARPDGQQVAPSPRAAGGVQVRRRTWRAGARRRAVSKRSPAIDQDFAARILGYAETPAAQPLRPEAEQLVETLLDALERGEVRAAERDADGAWHAVAWVKRGILLGFRVGRITEMSIGGHHGEPRFAFFDKHTFPPQALALESGARIVPGGSAVRRGAHLARGVVCMPPSYVNVG